MKQLLVFLSNIYSQVNESSGNFIRSDLIRVSCFHRTCETVSWMSHLLPQHRQDMKSWPLCDVLFGSCLQVEDMISEKNKKNKCQINMSKANSNNSIIRIFMKTYCLSGDPVFAQFHAFLHFIFKSTQQAAVRYECYFRQFTVQY